MSSSNRNLGQVSSSSALLAYSLPVSANCGSQAWISLSGLLVGRSFAIQTIADVACLFGRRSLRSYRGVEGTDFILLSVN